MNCTVSPEGAADQVTSSSFCQYGSKRGVQGSNSRVTGRVQQGTAVKIAQRPDAGKAKVRADTVKSINSKSTNLSEPLGNVRVFKPAEASNKPGISPKSRGEGRVS